MPTRRSFLRGVAGAAALGGFSRLARAFPAPAYPFVEVPASASGIQWVHSAGKSALKYLPETTGAGCAFLDYDNDGWMDIYLVNSGKCDFLHSAAPLRNALYRNNRDGTFTDVTEKAGVAGGRLRHGRRRRRLRWRRLPRSLRHAIRPQHSLSQQRRRHVHRRHRKSRASLLRDGPRARSGSTTTTTDGSICSSAGLSDFDKASSMLRHRRTANATTAFPVLFAPMPQLALPQQRRRHFYRCEQGVRNRRVISARPGAWSPPTSTTTAAWICSSPTTPSPTFSS